MVPQPGNSLTSINFDSASIPAVATPQLIPRVLNIFQGEIYGFIIEPAGYALPHSSLLKLKLKGFKNVGNDDFWAKPNTWYWAPCSGISLVPNDKLAFGETDVGQWVCNLAIQPYAHVQPGDTEAGFAGFPAATGGSPPVTHAETIIPVAGLKPTLATDGVALGLTAQLESTYCVGVDVTNEIGNAFIESGGIDLWHMQKGGSQGLGPNGDMSWFIRAENIVLTAGYSFTQIPIGVFGPRKAGDRFYATPSIVNPIVTNPVAANVNINLDIE